MLCRWEGRNNVGRETGSHPGEGKQVARGTTGRGCDGGGSVQCGMAWGTDRVCVRAQEGCTHTVPPQEEENGKAVSRFDHSPPTEFPGQVEARSAKKQHARGCSKAVGGNAEVQSCRKRCVCKGAGQPP